MVICVVCGGMSEGGVNDLHLMKMKGCLGLPINRVSGVDTADKRCQPATAQSAVLSCTSAIASLPRRERNGGGER